MTQGYELKGRNAGGRGCAGWRGIKGGGGEWDNCNSIINKIYFKKNITEFHQKYNMSKDEFKLHKFILTPTFPKFGNIPSFLLFIFFIFLPLKSFSAFQMIISQFLFHFLI